MCCGMFLVLLDVTVINVAVPAITTGLRTSTAGVQWVVDGYTVAIASLLLAGGTLGDRLGHKATVLAGLVIFGAASAGCALAAAPAELITARAAQGIGAALLLPGSLAAIADVFPDRAQQAKALGIWAAVSSLALPAGPLLGGFLVSSLGWRAVFWINPPVVVACAIGVVVWVPRGQSKTVRLDWPGIALATTALAAAVYAVIAAGGGTWTPVTAAAVVALVAGSGFYFAERISAAPLLPPSVFRRREFRVANAAALIMNLTANGTLFVLTRYLQTVLRHEAFTAGLMLLPVFVPMAVLAPVAGRVTARYGPSPALLTGAALSASGLALLLLADPARGYWGVFPALLGLGLGIGTFTAPVVAAAIRAVPPERSGLASGVNNTARQAGTALGVAIFGAAAGSPALTSRFLPAMHLLGAAAALAWLLVIAMVVPTARRLPRADPLRQLRSPVVADFDRTKPSIARVYDYVLGGKDNFEADRKVAEQLIGIFPELPAAARENREMLTRAVRWAGEQGVSQFIDLGCGLPTAPSTQESARDVVPEARVAYVDIDPVVLSHLNALLYQDPTAVVVDRDVSEPEAVLRDVAGLIDLDRPVCLMMGALLHFYGLPAARDLVARYAAGLAPGSYLVLSTFAARPGPDTDRLVKIYSSGPNELHLHSEAEVASFFGGLELVPPGVADARTWRPGWDQVPDPEPRGTWLQGGMALKTG